MKNSYFPNSIKQCILVLLLFFVFNGIIVAGLSLITNNLDIKITLNFILSSLCTIAIIYIINKKREKKLKFQFGIYDYNLLIISSLIVITYIVGISTPIFKSFLFPLFHDADSIITNPFLNPYIVISTIFLAPFFEEILFRGIILKGLLMNHSATKAILTSSILFAIIHFFPAQIINASFLGLFFGYIYFKTRSIGYTIILHFVANLTSLTAGYLNYKNGKSEINCVMDIYGQLSLYVIIISIIIFITSSYKIFHSLNNHNSITLRKK